MFSVDLNFKVLNTLSSVLKHKEMATLYNKVVFVIVKQYIN